MAERSDESVQGVREDTSVLESNSPPGGPSPPSQDPNCVFCRVSTKDAPAEIVYEDSEFVVFVDRKPVSTHHYLVIPRKHITDARSLTGDHVGLVEKMSELGKQVLTERGGNMAETRMGFHWPPFIFVKHLHLHVIAPEMSMSWLNRNLVFRKDSFAFSSNIWLIEHLKGMGSSV